MTATAPTIFTHKGYEIQPKQDFAPLGYLHEGRYIKDGYIVVRGGCNVMPDATWFLTIESAIAHINYLIEANGDVEKFWRLSKGEPEPDEPQRAEDLSDELSDVQSVLRVFNDAQVTFLLQEAGIEPADSREDRLTQLVNKIIR
jgi:hypothetical protein